MYAIRENPARAELLFWMSSVPLRAITASMPFDCFGFQALTRPQPGKRGRRPLYDHPDLLLPLKRIWLAANLPCSKRLKAILPLWLPGYAQQFGDLPPQISHLLARISPATIDRLLTPARVQCKRRGRTSTKPGTLLRRHIPIQTNQWEESRRGSWKRTVWPTAGIPGRPVRLYPGLRRHRHRLDRTTGRLGKGRNRCPGANPNHRKGAAVPLLGFDCDNGSEFLNHHLLRHFTQRKPPVRFTRSRAYHKDDNAHVEQKNWTHVRQWLGYQRFDHPPWSRYSMPSMKTNGGSSITSSAPR